MGFLSTYLMLPKDQKRKISFFKTTVVYSREIELKRTNTNSNELFKKSNDK